MRSRVVIVCVGGFWAGIALFELLPQTLLYLFVLGILGGVFLFVGFVRKNNLCTVGFLLITITIASSFGYARMYFANTLPDQSLETFVGKSIFLDGKIATEPVIGSRTQKIVLDADMVILNDASTTVSARVIVFVPPHPPLSYGGHVRVLGTLERPEAFADEETGRVFNYPAYLKKEGIFYTLSYAKVTDIGCREGCRQPMSVKAGLFLLRRTFVEGLSRAVGEPYAGLAAGVVFGIDGAISEDLEEVFRKIGLSHILVASGYNITLVAKAILRTFARAPPWVSRTCASLGIVGFVLMTGASSATVRAGIMALVALLGEALVRRYDITRALFLAGWGMTLVNPNLLLHDPSFQLSFAATWGLCTVAPPIQKMFVAKGPAGGGQARLFGSELLSATIGTQIAVLPLILFYAGGTSPYSLLANILALPVVPFLMITSIITGVFGLVVPILGVVSGGAVTLVGWYVIKVADVFSRLPGSFVQITFVTPLVCAMLYVGVVWLAKVLERKAPPGIPAGRGDPVL
ncbi:MAG: ComEC/Rec2 family competence protein [Patescibacteria group bacterium]